MVVVAIVVGNDIVSSEIDGVGTGNLEVDTLVLSNSNVEGLLVVLERN